MQFTDKDFKKILVIFLLVALIALVFFLIRPILIPIIGGLVLAYIFAPLYKFTLKYVKEKNTAAALVSLIAVLIILVPLWFILPILIEQMFEIFKLSQNLDIQSFVKGIFSSSSDAFVIQISATLNEVLAKLSSSVLTTMINFLLDLPSIILDLSIVAFVFFFGLRDSDNLSEFVKAISPIGKSHEKMIVDQFKGVTYSIIYGHIVIGIIQGLFAGIGLFVFGVPNALILTLLAIFLSVIPFTGAFFVWIPATFYLFSTGSRGIAIGYLLYNILIVSVIDNILRAYIVSRKTDLSPAIVLIGMVGGLFIFGAMGLIIGPLILAYLVTFLRSYKDKTLYTLFAD